MRRFYEVRTPNGWRTYKSVWTDQLSPTAAVDADAKTLEVSRPRVREHDLKVWKERSDPPCRFCGRSRLRSLVCARQFLNHILAHEISHLLYERPSELRYANEHFRWEFSHDGLAEHYARVNHIIRTGRDVPPRVVAGYARRPAR